MKAPKLVSLTVLLLFQAAVTTVFAQDKPKAGSVISGIVSDSEGPMMMVNVVERDSNDRIVAHSITDIEGVFSFRLVDPDHKIQVSYPGYKTDTIPIDTTFFNIRMKDAGDLPPVEIISDRVQETGPMPVPIWSVASDQYFMDLGLSVKWGTVNMGTTESRPYGWYWTWADAMKLSTGAGTGSRLATKAEWNELLDYCTWQWTEQDGKTGFLITSTIEGYRDRSIFLPASGWLQNGNIMKQHSYGSYWTSTPGVQPDEEAAYGFNFLDEGTEWHSENRFAEQSVRMVMPLSGSELTNISIDKEKLTIRQASVTRLNVTMAGGKRNVNSASTWKSSDEKVVSVMDDGLIVAVKPGTCVLTVQAYGKSAQCTVTVTPHEFEFVDLGLGVLWATCNLGADTPSDYGDYYAWAELETKDYYYWGNYRYCSSNDSKGMDKYTTDNLSHHLLKTDELDRLEPLDDVAYVLSGGEWHIPTAQDFKELIEKCTCNKVTVKGVKGVEFKSMVPGYKDKSIFIPYSGCMIDDELKGLGREYYLWSSTPGWGTMGTYLTTDIEYLEQIQSTSKGTGMIPEVRSIKQRFSGMNVRPVKTHSASMFSSLSLPAEHLDLNYGEIRQMVVSMMPSGRTVTDANITWSTSNADVAAVADGYLTAVGTGSCEITARSEGQEAKMTVTVTLPKPEPVDLGLSVKWASANLGASAPKEPGAFFAWGETRPKAGYYSGKNYKYGASSSDWRKYNFGKYTITNNRRPDYKETLDAEDDAATVLLGDGWRTPTADELWELKNKCTWTRVQDTIDSSDIFTRVKFHGYLITSNVPGYEGRSIFLPAAGYIDEYHYPVSADPAGRTGINYWTSTLNQSMGTDRRWYGNTIRPVMDKSEPGNRKKIEPDPVKPLSHNAQVDLGLSVLWADCNVGAESPEQCGVRFAWGETSPKTYYSEYNYKHMKTFPAENMWWYCKYAKKADNLMGGSFTDGKTRLEPEDDAARTNWGGKWRMPTKEEFAELYQKCEWTEDTVNGVAGYRVTSKVPGYTSKSIFLPFTPGPKEGTLAYYMERGTYMTSDLSSVNTNSCAAFIISHYEFGPGSFELDLGYARIETWANGDMIKWVKICIGQANRTQGAFIRAVCSK